MNQFPGAMSTQTGNVVLPASAYLDNEIFEAEKRNIFASSWQYVGHASMLANPGDFLTEKVVGASVLVVHGSDGELRAFYNVCQHRGHKLKDGNGNCSRIVCPYHAWSYALEGHLVGAPHVKKMSGFETERAKLKSVRMEVFWGFLFVNLDPEAPGLSTYAAELNEDIRKHAPKCDTLKHAYRKEFPLEANWKIAIDNYLECYHCQVVHKELVSTRDLTAYKVSACRNMSCQHSDQLGDVPESELEPWDMSDASDQHTASWWLWPSFCLIKHPGDHCLIALSHRVIGPRETVQVADFFFADSEPTEAEWEHIKFHCGHVRLEDKEVIEGVQLGLESGGFGDGQFVVPDDGTGAVTEMAVQHFQKLVRKAMNA